MRTSKTYNILSLKKTSRMFSILLFLLVVMGIIPILNAKNSSIKSDEISLLAAIERISQEYEVYFTFDMTLVSDVSVDYEENTYSTAEEAISHILKGTNL